MKGFLHILLSVAALCLASCARIHDPEVDFLSAPQAVGSTDTVFSWGYDEGDDFHQERCRIVIKGVWDSGEIATGDSRVVLPEDVLLSSLRKYRWKVEAWDAAGHKRTARSSFRTGIFPAGHWTGQWIAPALSTPSQPLFRARFTVGKGIKRAILCISSTGGHLINIDGKAVGSPYSVPTSLYGGFVGQYRVYDVTEEVSKRGQKELTVQVVAPQPALMAELHLFYKDGSHDRICTDDRWEVSLDGPYILLEGGVQYDALPDSLTWSPASLTDKGYSLLLPDESPLKALRRVVPSSEKRGDTLRIFEFGDPVRANCFVEANGDQGDIVELRYLSSSGKRIATDRLILGRKGRAKWADAFSGREFQQVEVAYPKGVKVKLQADVLPEFPSTWTSLRGKAEGFLLDPAPASAPFEVVDTLFSRYGDRRMLERAWPALESYLSLTKRKSLEEYTLMEKFALALGRDATPYTETRRIMTRK